MRPAAEHLHPRDAGPATRADPDAQRPHAARSPCAPGDRDRQKAPTGEVRWHTAARAERKAMIDEGLIVPAQPGVWQLTERGKLVAY